MTATHTQSALPPQRPLLAISIRLLGASLVAVLMALIKYAAEQGVSLPEILFWRQFVTIPVMLGFLALTGNLGSLRTRRLGTHIWRAALSMLAMFLYFFLVTIMPLAMATVLVFTSPLFAVVLAMIVLKESIGPWRWTALILGFSGIIVIAQPGGSEAQGITLTGVAIGLSAASVMALVSLQIRNLARTDSSMAIVFYSALFGVPIAAVLLPFTASQHDLQGWLLVAAIGIIGVASQACLTTSLKFAPVSTVMPMDYSSIILSTYFGWLVWNHIPGLSLWLGAPLIIAAGLMIAWRETLHKKSARTPSPVELD